MGPVRRQRRERGGRAVRRGHFRPRRLSPFGHLGPLGLSGPSYQEAAVEDLAGLVGHRAGRGRHHPAVGEQGGRAGVVDGDQDDVVDGLDQHPAVPDRHRPDLAGQLDRGGAVGWHGEQAAFAGVAPEHGRVAGRAPPPEGLLGEDFGLAVEAGQDQTALVYRRQPLADRQDGTGGSEAPPDRRQPEPGYGPGVEVEHRHVSLPVDAEQVVARSLSHLRPRRPGRGTAGAAVSCFGAGSDAGGGGVGRRGWVPGRGRGRDRGWGRPGPGRSRTRGPVRPTGRAPNSGRPTRPAGPARPPPRPPTPAPTGSRRSAPARRPRRRPPARPQTRR